MNINYNLKIVQNKIYAVFIIVFIFSIGNAFSNRVIKNTNFSQNEKLNNSTKVSIKKAFDYIEKNTSYHFFYNNKLIDLNTKVLYKNEKTNINNLLNTILNKTDLEYKINGKEILIRKKNNITKKKTSVSKKIVKIEQTNIITGIVFDDFNTPLPGVNVKVIGNKIGAVTNFDGNFTIEAKPEDTIEFTYMGFKTQTIKVGSKNNFSIIMVSSASNLDEIIISGVAAGTSKKKMSISVVKIKAEDLNMTPQSSVSASLSGKLAGVAITSLNGSPGSGSGITLRGATSLTGGQSPMILVDGVIMSGSLSDINVDDVKSIEVVKGAAASSLYGSRAGNGVIVITTKRGNKLAKNKIVVTFRNRYEVQQIEKYLELSNSHVFELSPDWLSATTYTKYNDVTYPSGYVSGWNPNIVGSRFEKYDGYQDLPYRVNNNLQETMFTNGLSHTNFIAGGYNTDNTNLYISLEEHKNNGIIIDTDGYNRYSLRANLDHKINDKLKLSASNSFIKTNNNFIGGGLDAFSRILQMEPDVDLLANNENGQKYNFLPNNWKINTIVHNPLYDISTKENNSNKLRFLGNYKLKYTINDFINAEISYAVESQNYHNNVNTSEGTYLGLNGDDTYRQSFGYDKKYISKIFSHNFRTTVNLSKSWNDVDFKGKLSYLFEDYKFNSKENIDTFAEDPSNDSHSLEERQNQVIAINYFAIGSVVYKDRYIFDALLRYDGSSLFGENERWYPYYRLSGAYRVTKDITLNNIEELKLRAAIGTSGQRPTFYDQYETFFRNEDESLEKRQLGNKNLQPSHSTEYEIGLDVSFLNRFRLETTYSKTNTENQVIKYPLAAPFGGFTSQIGNVGSLESKTFEASLQSKIIKQKNLKWNLGLTFDKTSSKITKLDVPAFEIGPQGAFRIENGGEYGDMYGYSLVRTLDQMEAQLPQGKSINDYEVNSDGIVVLSNDIGTTDEAAIVLLDDEGYEKQSKIGSVVPKFRMGLNTNISYKKFSFYMLWKWKNGGQIYNYTAQRLVQAHRHPMMDQRFTEPENKKTVSYYQSLYNKSKITDFWIEDASYVKLNEVSLYYNIQPKKYIENLKIGIMGKNLYTFTNYTGYDPESGYKGFVFDNYGYPNFRSYAVSLELKF